MLTCCVRKAGVLNVAPLGRDVEGCPGTRWACNHKLWKGVVLYSVVQGVLFWHGSCVVEKALPRCRCGASLFQHVTHQPTDRRCCIRIHVAVETRFMLKRHRAEPRIHAARADRCLHFNKILCLPCACRPRIFGCDCPPPGSEGSSKGGNYSQPTDARAWRPRMYHRMVICARTSPSCAPLVRSGASAWGRQGDAPSPPHP